MEKIVDTTNDRVNDVLNAFLSSEETTLSDVAAVFHKLPNVIVSSITDSDGKLIEINLRQINQTK